MGIALAKRVAITSPQVKDVGIDGVEPDLDIGPATIVRITSATNSPALHGIKDTTPNRIVMIQNLSGSTVSVVFGSPNASPPNRLKEGSGTVNLLHTQSMAFHYRSVQGRWVLLSHSI